jgi:ArsR family transcriptional regulator
MADPKNKLSTEPALEDAATVLKALADPNRLRILDELIQHPSCNCELNDRLGMPPNLLSHHLRILRRAKLVKSRRDVVDGRWIYYTVDREAIIQWRDWFNQFLDPARIQERPVLCGPEGQQKEREDNVNLSSNLVG